MRRARSDIVERAEELATLKPDSNLLGRLPNRRPQQVRVTRAMTTPGQAHLPGPRVAGSFCPANEKNGIGIGGEDDRHGGAGECGIVFDAR
jgi:hypothetical protein